MEVRDLIQELEQAGVKQAQNVVAGALGVNKSTVSKWVGGSPCPQLSALRKVVSRLVQARAEIGGELAGNSSVFAQAGEVVFLLSHKWRTADFLPLSAEQLRALFPWGLGGNPGPKEPSSVS